MTAMTATETSYYSLLNLNAARIFHGQLKAGSSISISLCTALNGKRCGVTLTAGASVLVELVEFRGPQSITHAETRVARKPMVRDTAEAAIWLETAVTEWLANNAA